MGAFKNQKNKPTKFKINNFTRNCLNLIFSYESFLVFSSSLKVIILIKIIAKINGEIISKILIK